MTLCPLLVTRLLVLLPGCVLSSAWASEGSLAPANSGGLARRLALRDQIQQCLAEIKDTRKKAQTLCQQLTMRLQSQESLALQFPEQIERLGDKLVAFQKEELEQVRKRLGKPKGYLHIKTHGQGVIKAVCPQDRVVFGCSLDMSTGPGGRHETHPYAKPFIAGPEQGCECYGYFGVTCHAICGGPR